MQINRNILYYSLAVGIFALLKLAYTFADTVHLIFLIKPTNKLIELLTGSHSVYLSGKGYFYEQLNIMIDKSCSGFNFLLLNFLVFAYLSINYIDKSLYKVLLIPAVLVGAYLLTIFANTSRIYTSIVVQTHTEHMFTNHQHLIHEAVGIVTNLTFLVLFYVFVEKLLIYKQNNAKFT